MPPLSKLRLSILLLFLQLFVYLYVVPRGHQEERAGGYPLEEHCKLSFASLQGCPSARRYFQELAGNCGILKEKVEVAPEPEPEPPVIEEVPEEPKVESPPVPEEEPPVVVVEDVLEVQPPVAVLKEETNNSKPLEEVVEKPTETVAKTDSVHEKSGHLIYQIIVVLLFLSVSFALADCFQERAKKKGNPESERHDGLSRRMSLADLTMSRHARKESQQASYRPVGKPRNDYPFGNLMDIEQANKKTRQMPTPYNYPEGAAGVFYARRCR